MRPHPSPFMDEEEIDKHQYFNGNLKAFLLQALLEKRTDHLGHNAVQLACGLNHTLHEMVGFCSTKIIATSGQLPTTKLSTAPLAFASCCHTDLCDKLSWEQLLDLKIEWDHDCFKRKLLDFQGFSVPTTCGYQLVYESDDIFKLLQFFSLNRLGLAMDICHGMMHHFMAASFSHQTCLSVSRSCLELCITNWKNNAVIFAWGGAGSRKIYAACRQEGLALGSARQGDNERKQQNKARQCAIDSNEETNSMNIVSVAENNCL